MLLALIAAYAFYEIQFFLSGVQTLSPTELTLLLNRGAALLVDVRPHALYSQGHILHARASSRKILLLQQPFSKRLESPEKKSFWYAPTGKLRLPSLQRLFNGATKMLPFYVGASRLETGPTSFANVNLKDFVCVVS